MLIFFIIYKNIHYTLFIKKVIIFQYYYILFVMYYYILILFFNLFDIFIYIIVFQ